MPLAAATRLGPYEIVAPAGAGGMGEVYKARDTRLDRIVAIKVSNEQFTDRFQREARAVAALNHPNICQLYDVGPNYLVMEFIDGSPLGGSSLGPVDHPRKLLDLAVQVAEGLAAAHAAGIVHRDLKPDNILVTRDGRVKILDFGLAKSAQSSTSSSGVDATVTHAMNLTDAGATVGTVNYMSPEQARGEPDLTFQSDQFSFGLVLYKLASGQRAFDRPSAAETMTAIIREEAEPLPDTIPAPLRWVIERLLAKEPAERYDSTRDLYRELKQIRDRLSQSTSAVGATPAATAAAAPKRKRFLILGAAALACIAIGSVLGLLLSPPSGPDLSHYKFTQLTPGEAEQRFPAWSPDGKSIASTARVHGLMQVFTRAVGSPDSAQLTHAKSDCFRPFWSPDGESVYFLTGDNQLWAVGASGGAERLVLDHVAATAIHPDGKTLAIERDGKLWLTSLQGTSPKEFWPGPLAASLVGTKIAFSPDGTYLAATAGSEVWLFPYPKGEPRRLYTGASLDGASWFPDSRRLLVSNMGPTSSLVELNVSGRERVLHSASSTLMSPAVSPDGGKIAYSAGDYQWDLIELDLATGGVQTLIANGELDTMPDWAPSGTHYLYVTGTFPALAIVDKEDSPDGFSRRLIENDNAATPRWSPDGAHFAYTTLGADMGATSKLMLANASGGHAVALDRAYAFVVPAWSPDGQWLAYLRGERGKLKLAKIAAAPGAAPVALDDAAVWNAWLSTQWLPGDWILYPNADGLHLISSDGKSRRKLTSRQFETYTASRDGRQVYGIFHNTTGPGAEWQLYIVDVQTGAEKPGPVIGLPPATAALAGFSIHPGGKRALTSVAKWPFQNWMLEGFDQPRKNWFQRLIRR